VLTVRTPVVHENLTLAPALPPPPWKDQGDTSSASSPLQLDPTPEQRGFPGWPAWLTNSAGMGEVAPVRSWARGSAVLLHEPERVWSEYPMVGAVTKPSWTLISILLIHPGILPRFSRSYRAFLRVHINS